MRIARLALPWALGLGIIGALVAREDPARLRAALLGVDLLRFLPIACAFIALWLALDAFVLRWLYSRLAAPLRWAEMLRLRGSSYLLMVLSYDLGNAALVALLHRFTGAPLSRLTGALLVHYACDVLALCALAWLASLGIDLGALAAIRPLLGGIALTLAVLLLAAGSMRTRFGERPFVRTLLELRRGELLRLVLYRATFYLSFVLFAWLTLPAAAVDVSFRDVAARFPVVMSAGALPITAAGLGTTQAAMVALFSGLADSTSLLAWALVYSLSLIVLRLPIGMILSARLAAHPERRSTCT